MLEVLIGVGIGTAASGSDAVLSELAGLQPPNLDRVVAVAEECRQAAFAVLGVEGTDSASARSLIGLLSAAVKHHESHADGECPVCGAGTLDAAWRTSAENEIARLRAHAEAADAAHARAAAARRAAHALTSTPPAVLRDAESAGLDGADVVAAWTAWETCTTDDELLGNLADRLEHAATALITEVEVLRGQAEHARDQREATWRPVALKFAAFVAEARSSQETGPLPPRTSCLVLASHRHVVCVPSDCGDAGDRAALPTISFDRLGTGGIWRGQSVRLGESVLASTEH